MSASVRLSALVSVLVLLTSLSAAAEPIHELRYDLPLDLAVTGTGAALWAGTAIFKSSLAPSDCRWCDRNADGTDALNGLDSSVRSAVKWSDTGTANALSNWTAYAVVPGAALGLDALSSNHDGGTLRQFGVDALVIAQSSVLAADLAQVVKLAAGRERPFVHALPPDQKASTAHPEDNNVSFFSSHTAWTFAVATSSGMVASMRGYRLAPLVWGVGMPLAALTGYLRIAADKHYFTDVAVGALVGAAVGVTVPLLVHARENSPGSPSVSASASPLAFTIAGTF